MNKVSYSIKSFTLIQTGGNFKNKSYVTNEQDTERERERQTDDQYDDDHVHLICGQSSGC